MQRLKTKKVQDEKELSLVERILANEPDIKTAYILALDLILVGIDTVRSKKIVKTFVNCLFHCRYQWQSVRYFTN